MHKKAEDYDTKKLEELYKREPPQDRPCEWCGEKIQNQVYQNMHKKCFDMKRLGIHPKY